MNYHGTGTNYWKVPADVNNNIGTYTSACTERSYSVLAVEVKQKAKWGKS